ncbi:M48 family metalloprotease [Nocardioides sp. CFH 31398]|uniref:M48 family metalloprotease n=1 Tax=Nocardioides sp. CFH 31398 TaxID=2919579 RepID=UPI001F06E30A|nr:M48 family metalloprotease [Nocardioides sp. CFH 31398]MCH1868218.1 M48 family metalloprotease [Nocardioides sp. CFH 31398]
MTGHRRVALVVLLLAGGAFALLTLLLVPWDPVPGARPPAAPADSVFTADQLARAEAYSSAARSWGRTSLVVSLGVSLVLGFTRLGRRLVARLPGPWWVAVPLAVVAVLLVGRLATLPFSALGRIESLRYGLTEQGWAAWGVDVLVSFTVQSVATSLALLVLLGVRRRLPTAWPAAAAGLMAALVLAASFAYPVVVEPLRNTFTSLPDGPLRTEILDVARQEGIAVDDVLVSDASRRTTTLNAYVSGFGGTRRVVVYDTLVGGLPTREVVSVVAHELAHARHDDVLVGSVLGAAGAAAGAGLLGLLLPGRRRGEDDDEVSDELALVPRVLALLAVATLLATPVQSTISRQVELRADVDALCVTRDPEAFERLQAMLATRSLSDPEPAGWSQVVFGTHPTALERIGLARGLDCG